MGNSIDEIRKVSENLMTIRKAYGFTLVEMGEALGYRGGGGYCTWERQGQNELARLMKLIRFYEGQSPKTNLSYSVGYYVRWKLTRTECSPEEAAAIKRAVEFLYPGMRKAKLRELSKEEYTEVSNDIYRLFKSMLKQKEEQLP